MPYSHLNNITPELLARAEKIRLVCFDVDGTLTDGRIYIDGNGLESKAYDVVDGQGLAQMRRFGIRVALITARNSQSALRRGTELNVETYIAAKDKLACVRELCEKHGLELDQVAFMGDDLPDIPPLRHVGLPVVPANVHPWTRPHGYWQTTAAGGQGAARELCDLLLGAQGHVDTLLKELQS